MKLRILIADDEPAARFGMARALSRGGYEILEATDGKSALSSIREQAPHLVFLDLGMPEGGGQVVLKELGGGKIPCEVIVVTANSTIQSAVECMQLGAADYITKPYEVEQLRAIARRTARRLDLEERVEDLQDRLDEKKAFGALVGISQPMRQIYRGIERAAPAPLDILIRGETGTGKELIAREIHRLSQRAGGPFVAVNTAALPENLAESELFGHQRGAFTGAEADRQGVFQQASGGSLFLDEIGDMPPAVQGKILRALQERVVQPVGSSRSISVDVRVISATHQDLNQAVSEGHFRQDLYYRIRGIELRVPPLRARREDILILANFFLERLATRTPAPIPVLRQEAVDLLLAHSWPGNVRELEQVVTAAAAMREGDEITAGDLGLPAQVQPLEDLSSEALLDLPLTEAKARLVESFERRAILRALEKRGGNISAAARSLGIHRQSLQQKMAQLSISRPERAGRED